jgi:hypothetical protein
MDWGVADSTEVGLVWQAYCVRSKFEQQACATNVCLQRQAVEDTDYHRRVRRDWQAQVIDGANARRFCKKIYKTFPLHVHLYDTCLSCTGHRPHSSAATGT